MFGFKKATLVTREEALPGRPDPMVVTAAHHVSGASLTQLPADAESILFGMGCFWGAERKFWSRPGVYVTAVGYAGGFTKNPTYEEVCSGLTGHTEVVRVSYAAESSVLQDLLEVFWESHNPTQGMRQGNDAGTQYRSAIYVHHDAQWSAALGSKEVFQAALLKANHGTITTEIARDQPFYFAESYHQQYLSKNPNGYCGLGGTGVSCSL